MNDNNLKGYIKKVITFIIPTQCGDKWLNHEDYDFFPTKGEEIIVIEEKTK